MHRAGLLCFDPNNGPGTGTIDPPVTLPVIPTGLGTDAPKVKHPPSVVCDFCQCKVTTMRGEVLSMSDRAKVLGKAEQEAEAWKAEAERLRVENATLKAAGNPTTTPPTAPKRGWDR